MDTEEIFLSALLLEAALCITGIYDCCHLTDHILIIKTETTAGLESSLQWENGALCTLSIRYVFNYDFQKNTAELKTSRLLEMLNLVCWTVYLWFRHCNHSYLVYSLMIGRAGTDPLEIL